MKNVQLNDGTIEIIGSHRDLVDIVREKCGNDIAAMIEENDPEDWENVIAAENIIYNAIELLENVDENGLLTAGEIETVKDKLNGALNCILEVI